MADESIDRGELLALTAEIVAAHVGNNAVAGSDVAALIQRCSKRLVGWPPTSLQCLRS